MDNKCQTLFVEEERNVKRNTELEELECRARESSMSDESNNGLLVDTTRFVRSKIGGRSLKHLADKLILFIEQKFESPTKQQVANVCLAAIELFSTIGEVVCSNIFALSL